MLGWRLVNQTRDHDFLDRTCVLFKQRKDNRFKWDDIKGLKNSVECLARQSREGKPLVEILFHIRTSSI